MLAHAKRCATSIGGVAGGRGRDYLSDMVELHLRDGAVDVDVRGLHKVWALKSHLRIPLKAITIVRRPSRVTLRNLWKGWRAPGTHLPGYLVAGTYYKGGERHFWDVRRPTNAIEIGLSGADYDRIFIEVDDPEAEIRRIEDARAAA